MTLFAVASILLSMAGIIAYVGWLAYSREKNKTEKNSLKEINKIYEEIQRRDKEIDLRARGRMQRIRDFMRNNVQANKNSDAG